MKKLCALLIIVVLVNGCAYYNTFFNAENYFKEAQKMALKENGRPSSSAIQKYNKVIKKCGIVITDYPKSDYSDDAVMLMGRSFFYKGTNYGQASTKFNDIITYYPKSEFVGDAYIYLAKISFEKNKKEEAYRLLKELIKNPDFKDYHSKALMTLADYQLKEENLSEADYYLNQIITNYPKSEQYEDAFFARGKTLYIAEKYLESNEVFTELLNSSVSKKIKLDSRYYIILNYILTEQFVKAEKFAKKLLKQEYRESKLSKIQLVYARAKAGNGKIDSAIDICKNIIDNNKRTLLSAETCFYLGEYYFELKKDYEKAIEYYNDVKVEKKKSPFVKDALAKSVVAAQIIQYYQPDSKILPEDLVLQQFKLAEYYIATLDMPDSAIVVYDNVLLEKEKFIILLDSLEIRKIDLANIIQDSLATLDSLGLLTDHTMEFVGSIAQSDSIVSEEKEIQISETEKVSSDSLEIFDNESKQDSVFVNNQATVDSTEYIEVISQIERTKKVIEYYETDFVPYTKLVKLWLYRNVIIDSSKAEIELNDLLKLGLENKYGYAANLFVNGEDVVLTTLSEYLQKNEYKEALRHLESDPAKVLYLLKPIVEDSLNIFQQKAIYSSAYINYMILGDSTSAEPFVKLILAEENSEFKSEIENFYGKNKFLKFDRLPYLDVLKQKEEDAKVAAEAAEIARIEAEEEKNNDHDAKVLGGSTIKWPIIRDELDTNVIIVQVNIDENGNVGEMEVIQSLKEDKKSLDNIVLAQIKGWKFAPAQKDGKAISSILELIYTYEPE